MKQLKIFAAFFLVAITVSFSKGYSQARQVFTLYGMTGAGTYVANDTTANTDTTYLVLPNKTSTPTAIKPYNQYDDVVYEWTAVPSITGTTTSGTVVVAEGSNTGTFAAYGTGDWVTLISDVTQYNGSSSVSISGSSAIHGYFIIPNCQFKYVRLVEITAGTQTSTITGTVSVLPHG